MRKRVIQIHPKGESIATYGGHACTCRRGTDTMPHGNDTPEFRIQVSRLVNPRDLLAINPRWNSIYTKSEPALETLLENEYRNAAYS